MYRLIITLLIAFFFNTNTHCKPFAYKNTFLNHYIFLSFYPEDLDLLYKNKNYLSLELIYSLSNIILIYPTIEDQNLYESINDFELNVLNLKLSKNLTKNLNASLVFGFANYWGGILDNIIYKYHKIFKFPQGHRVLTENNKTNYKFSYDNKDLFNRSKSTYSFLDTSFILRYNLIAIENSNISFYNSLGIGIEIPTGNINLGTSNKKIDLGIVIDSSIKSQFLNLYNNFYMVKLNSLKNNSITIPTKKYKFGANLSIEKFIFKKCSIVAQALFETKTYNTKHISIDKNILLLILGLNLYKNKKSQIIQLSFVEDLTHDNTPDVGFNVSFLTNF